MGTDETRMAEWEAGVCVAEDPAGYAVPDRSVTGKIIGAAFEVHNALGYGYLERVYQRALQVELLRCGLQAEAEHRMQVLYKGVVVGDYAADLFVEAKVLVELKVAPAYRPEDEAQLLNELKATGVRIGLLINFGRERVEFRRFRF